MSIAEAVISRVEQKRFPINSQSLELMKGLRDVFTEMQEQRPYLSGLGFFGSRTRGQEHNSSDIDLVIFYDSSKFPKKTTPLKNPNFVIESFKGRLIQAGNGVKIHMVVDDISQKITEKYIEELISSRPRQIFERIVGKDPKTDLGVPVSQLSLAGRFFLAIGNDIYRSRRFILERLKAMPDGDRYWQILMGALAKVESGSRRRKGNHRQYQRYPQTIEEAEWYFLIRLEQVVIIPEADEQRLEENLGAQGMIGNLVKGVIPNF